MKSISKSDALTFIGGAVIIVEILALIGIHTIRAEAQPIDIYEAPPIETRVINEVETAAIPEFLLNQDTEPETKNCIDIVETEPETLYPAPKETYLGRYKLTAYCSCGSCNGYDKNGNPRSYDCHGDPLVPGTIAVDPKVIPLGSKVRIGDMTYTARDTGGKGVQGEHIDIYMTSHAAAKQFGLQHGDVWLIND